MSKVLRIFIESVNLGLGEKGLFLTTGKRGRYVVALAPYTKRGTPRLKVQAHLRRSNLLKGWN